MKAENVSNDVSVLLFSGQLPGRRVQVPNRCGFVPGLDLPGRTCIPAWWGNWTVTVLECKYRSTSNEAWEGVPCLFFFLTDCV